MADIRTETLIEVAAFFEGSGNEVAAEELREQYPDVFGEDEDDDEDDDGERTCASCGEQPCAETCGACDYPEDDDRERTDCPGCGESWNATESDADDPDAYCSESCERRDGAALRSRGEA